MSVRNQTLYVLQCFYCCSHRESPSPTRALTETTGEEPEDQPDHTDHGASDHRSYFEMLSTESTEARPPSPLTSKFDFGRASNSRHSQASSIPADGLVNAYLPKSQPQDLSVTDKMYPVQNIKTGIF